MFAICPQHNAEQWRIVWLISAAIYVVGNSFFVAFGSGETQPWNSPEYLRAKQASSDQGLQTNGLFKSRKVV